MNKKIEEIARLLNAKVEQVIKDDEIHFNELFRITWDAGLEVTRLIIDLRNSHGEMFVVVDWPMDTAGQEFKPTVDDPYDYNKNFVVWFSNNRSAEFIARIISEDILPKVRKAYVEQLECANKSSAIWARVQESLDQAVKINDEYFGSKFRGDAGVWDSNKSTFFVRFNDLDLETLKKVVEAAQKIIN